MFIKLDDLRTPKSQSDMFKVWRCSWFIFKAIVFNVVFGFILNAVMMFLI